MSISKFKELKKNKKFLENLQKSVDKLNLLCYNGYRIKTKGRPRVGRKRTKQKMDIVCIRYYLDNVEHRIDFISDDFNYQTCMWTDAELMIAAVHKWELIKKENPLADLLGIDIVAR